MRASKSCSGRSTDGSSARTRPDDDCECRKPKPKLILDAARAWGIQPSEIVVIGDKASDEEAACNAGARGFVLASDDELPSVVDRLLKD